MSAYTRATRRIFACLAALVSLMAATALSALPASATFPGDNGRLYGVQNFGSRNLWSMNPDGSDRVQLTTGQEFLAPSVSPDGRRLAALRWPDPYNTRSVIVVMNVDGSNQRTVPAPAAFHHGLLSWSADMSAIVATYVDIDNPMPDFSNNYDVVAYDIVSGARTTLVGGLTSDTKPNLSPDGQYLAWVRTQSTYDPPTGNVKLMLANANGGNPAVLEQVQVTNGTAAALGLAWHPDSGSLQWEVQTQTPTTVEQRNLTIDLSGAVLAERSLNDLGSYSGTINEGFYSPDGTQIVYAGNVYEGGQQFQRTVFTDANGNVQSVKAFKTPDGMPIYISSWAIFVQPQADVEAPTISVASPTGDLLLGSSVSAQFSCADNVAVTTCEGTVADGALLDTATVGPKSFTVTAEDAAGNEVVRLVTYNVIWPFGGFTGPVDGPPTLNASKAGGVVPVKFSLGGDRGLAILAAGYPKSAKIACSTGAAVDALEEYATTPGNNTLSYSAATQQYGYNWKTDKSWAGSCRQLIVKLADGSTAVANFQFK